MLFASIFAGLIATGTLMAVHAFAGNAGGGLAEAAAPEATPQIVDTRCRVGTIDFANHGDFIGTTSTAFVDIPGATVTFKQGGRVADCIKVEFESMSFTTPNQLLFVRAVLDGAVVGAPGDVQFSGDDDEDEDGRWDRSHAMAFFFDGVAPGTHTVQIQFRSFSGGSVRVNRGSTAVSHR